jgi:RHS repeat-associated protein
VALEDLQYEFNLDDEINKITSLAAAPLTPQSKTVSTADAANRIGQFGAASLSFDAEGQTTSKTDASGTTAYQWDARGRLAQTTLPSGQVVGYGYDVLGRRGSRAANGVTTTFQYDGADVVIDREIGGSTYDYLNGARIDDKLRQTGGSFGTLYFLQDHLSSTEGLASASGGLVEPPQQYEAFGVSVGSMRTRYGYTGRERDELSGLMHYRARWYDPQQGRFLGEDPIGFYDGPNRYVYVRNNPVAFVDPEGMQGWHPGNFNSTELVDRTRDADRRRRYGHNRFPGEVNSFMRHCTISCETDMAWRLRADARLFGIGNEIQGFIWHDLFRLPSRLSGETPWAFQLDDLSANESGFSCADKVRSGECSSCVECCEKEREEGQCKREKRNRRPRRTRFYY